ncbi:hypothetical protein TNCV_199811 [Trichonephila clavipes]|nr:hypothetical protein TNCV_199811 [Trichonephila clavipes]
MALVPRTRQSWPKCPQSHFPLDLCERESTADEFDAMLKVVLTCLNMPRTRQEVPPLAQPASEKFNLIELIPMYDGSESLGIRRFLGKINDVAELGGWSNAEKVTILNLKLAEIAKEFFFI